MKAYIKNIIPRIKKYSQKLDDMALLTNKHWVVIDEIENSKLVYVFRSNNELLISKNGRVEKGNWEHIGNNSLLIGQPSGDYLFRQGFFDENVLALKVDGLDEYSLLINQNNYEEDINSVEKVISFLNEKYLRKPTFVESKLPKSSNTISIKQEHDPAVPILKNGKYGFIDNEENPYIEFKYDWAEKFTEGLALIKKGKKFGFINNQGNVVIDIIYDGASTFHLGKSSVNLDGENYYIDKNGIRQ